MRASEFIAEGKSTPVIVVDVQPEYSGINDGNENEVFSEIIHFVNGQTGPVLMFVNAEEHGLTGDTVDGIKQYWDDTVEEIGKPPINWSRFTINDKGYGYFRTWMDSNVSPAAIIRVIRRMYTDRAYDSRQLFGGEDSPGYERGIRDLTGAEFEDWMLDDPIVTNWASVALLKRFSGSYLVGGGRNECLREVELLMNAFNIRYKRIDSLVY